ncbi:hypothetical protein [Streptomyces sp. WAC00263]|nr:hypothetical protein [Streptomyces sp. WAC00263]
MTDAGTGPTPRARYRRVVMPLSGPAIATVAVLAFLPMRNAYL